MLGCYLGVCYDVVHRNLGRIQDSVKGGSRGGS